MTISLTQYMFTFEFTQENCFSSISVNYTKEIQKLIVDLGALDDFHFFTYSLADMLERNEPQTIGTFKELINQFIRNYSNSKIQNIINFHKENVNKTFS